MLTFVTSLLFMPMTERMKSLIEVRVAVMGRRSTASLLMNGTICSCSIQRWI